MIQLLSLLWLLFHLTSAAISTNFGAHVSEVLKLKCDALPYRSVYVERNCYFATDADADCSRVMGGSRLAREVPSAVWAALFADKNDFMLEGDSSAGKKKAMCFYENQHAAYSSDKPNTETKPPTSGADQMMTARMQLPFRLPFTEGVEVGQTIAFKGVVTAPAKNFIINFQRGNRSTAQTRDSKGDIPFHISFRISTGHVIFGSLIKGTWTPEKTLRNPLRLGDTVDIRVFVQEQSYQVFLNNQELYTYAAVKATPLSLINHLYIYGDGVINYVKLGEKYSPIPRSNDLPSLSASGSISQGEELVTKRANLPHLTPFEKKLEVGQTIVIKGGTAADCTSYVINFQSGTKDTNTTRNTGGDIPFHISFRLHSGKVIFNTLTRGKWVEEKQVSNPLRRDADVDLRIRILADRFQVFFNQKQLYVYKSRQSLANIDHLLIYGQGYVNSVRLEDKFTPSSVESAIPHAFPVCGRQSCAAQVQMFTHQRQLADCKSLVVSGSALGNSSFFIKLIRSNGDVVLNIEPSFSKKNVGLSTYKDGKWLDEEIINEFPFEKNVRFVVAITNEANAFQIFVNDKHFASYTHRTCPSGINLLDIQKVFDIDVLSK